MFKARMGVGALLLLGACGVHEPRPVLDQGAPSPFHAGARRPAYRIDRDQSEVRLLVYRAGPMARFGHNHVIVNRALDGWVDAADRPTAASFAVSIPIAAFIVDDSAARTAEGREFGAEVSQDAREGTRHNMLSAAVLDAEHFPAITLSSLSVSKSPDALTATLTVAVAGHQSTIVIPFSLEESAERIRASGTAMLRQSDLGLIPFSVMLGALKVQDEFTVKFWVVATKT